MDIQKREIMDAIAKTSYYETKLLDDKLTPKMYLRIFLRPREPRLLSAVFCSADFATEREVWMCR